MEKYLIFVSHLIILFLSPLSSATGRTPRTANFRTTLAEKLIEERNLFPKESVNIADRNDSAFLHPARKLVEKRFKFPNCDCQDPVSPEDLGHYAGYYQIQHSNAAIMFYFFFESRNSKMAPVVIWLTGGPGCSSDIALFYENGPFTIANDLSLVWNEYGWDKRYYYFYDNMLVSNLLYVDQPIGTGFSYSSDKRDIRHNEEGVSDDLYDFFQAFLAEHPQFVNNDFYITGESYAGHYVPAFAARVHNANKAKEGTNINLKGFAIGNGLTNPEIQYRANTDFALDMGIINKTDYERINQMLPGCAAAIKLCGTNGTISCLAAQYVCSKIFSSIMAVAGKINYYDIRKKCEGSRCYDFSNMEKLLNMKSVRDSLGVGDINFTSCNHTVYLAMLVDWVRNYEVVIPALLEDGVKLLVYAGEYDLICNWLGNSRWVHTMEWSGQKEFVGSAVVPFKVDRSEAGILKSYGPLSFLKVHDAGHMVPMDQPKVALEMLKRWTQSSLSGVTAEPENSVFSI